MNNERLQILRMVQEGKLSPEEAAKLLEVVEQPDKTNGKKPRMLRIHIVDGAKEQNVSLSLAMVRWLLKLPGTTIDFGDGNKVDRETLLDAIASGAIGKVAEWEEGKYRVELWLEA